MILVLLSFLSIEVSTSTTSNLRISNVLNGCHKVYEHFQFFSKKKTKEVKETITVGESKAFCFRLGFSEMVRKKLDERIRTLLERGVVTGQRSMLVIVGDHGKDQIPNLHQLLTKTSVRARPKVLWCYKKELGFSSHRKKVRT